MTPRLATGVAVAALIRRVNAAGGHATVLARGDATAGALVLVLAERGRTVRIVARSLDQDGRYAWRDSGPPVDCDGETLAAFIARSRKSDPDLWVVELDVPHGQRFADEMVITG